MIMGVICPQWPASYAPDYKLFKILPVSDPILDDLVGIGFRRASQGPHDLYTTAKAHRKSEYPFEVIWLKGPMGENTWLTQVNNLFLQ